MQKSGTAYFYNILNDIIKASGANDVSSIKKKYSLENILSGANNNIDGISFCDLSRLIYISKKEGTFAVKTHFANRTSMRFFSYTGLIKIIYSYRDPRDVILSVLDYSRKLIESGGKENFAKMSDPDTALRNVSSWIKDWKAISGQKKIFTYKYEDLVTDPEKILEEVMSFTGITVSSEELKRILFAYNPENPDMPGGRLHFNKGKINRYKTDMDEKTLSKIMDTIGKDIYEMGYGD